MKKIALRILIAIVVIIVGFVLFVNLTWDKKQEAPLVDNIVASKDSAVIARGKYLAFGPAHCATCHVPMNKISDIEKGVEMPLIGGWEIDIPPGTFRAPNLTPDKETGIGNMTDGEIARSLRYSVNRYHKTMFPFMPFQEISDEDLVAIISFLRSQQPVKNEVPKSKFKFLGKALIAMGVVKPAGPVKTPPKSVPIDSTPMYGEYIAHRVANCVGCHTNRDLKTGEQIGEPFAGGLAMPADEMSNNITFVTPNLTPDPETGVMANWSEQAFINRFRAGRALAGSHMPWGVFSRMNEVELKAVYRYLRTLKPVKKKIEKTAYKPGEELPENL